VPNTKPVEYIKLKCSICGKEFHKVKSIYKKDMKKCNAGKFCSFKCYTKSHEIRNSKGKKGILAHGWKGGRIYERGYKMILVDDHPNAVLKGGGLKYVREHRIVMEKHIGRLLTKDEVVHHKNGNTLDNRIENLELMTNSQHCSMHIKEAWKRKKTYCGGGVKK
jgi:hypothetical protein